VKKIALILAFALTVATVSVPSAMADDPLEKLGRGITNVVGCPFEISNNLQRIGDEKGFAAGFLEGTIKGVWYTVGRALTGIYDIATFLIPLPGQYKPLMKPASVFDTASET